MTEHNDKSRPFQISIATASLFGGTIGGMIINAQLKQGLAGVISGHPFDTIKVRLQTQSISAPIYRGTLHCALTVVKNESIFGLFKGTASNNALKKGMVSPMVGVAVVNSLLFGVYGAVLDAQRTDRETPNTLGQIFVAGSVSGLLNAFIASPMELIKIQLQNQGARSSGKSSLVSETVQFKGPADCIQQIYRNTGIRGLFRALPVTIIRETPSYGAYFVSYEIFCRSLKQENEELSGWRLMLAGGLGGVVGWASTYPFDVVKTIIQSDKNILDSRHKPIRMMDCMMMVYRHNGIPALFRGLSATVIRAFPTNVAILTTWQMTMTYFRDGGWISE